MKKILGILKNPYFGFFLAVLLYVVPPVIVSNFYIQQITINEFAPTISGNTANLSSSPASVPLNANSSTSVQSFASDPKFLSFDTASSYLSLFNINPSLIRYNLYLSNMANVHLDYSEIGSNSPESITLPSILGCGENLIKSGSQPTLLKSGLLLNDQSSADRDYVNEVYSNCVTKSAISVQNTLGRYIVVRDIEIGPNSGINISIEPEPFSDDVIVITFITLWIGFVTLIIEGPVKFWLRYLDFIKKKK